MSNAVAEKSPATNVANLLERMKPQFMAALPKTMSADRMARIALTQYRTTPKLQQCDPNSFLAAVMQCAQLGLEPGLNGSAYLVPFKKSWKENGQWCSRMEVQMIPGFRGLIDLARRSGNVQSIAAEIVYERDTFKLSLGVEQTITHEPYLEGERGKPKLVYAVAQFKDGGHQFIWMTMSAVDAIRARSKSKDDGPWVTDYDEMVKKTAVRRLCKMLPMSVELANAITLSDAVDRGVQPIIDGDLLLLPAPPEEGQPDAQLLDQTQAEKPAEKQEQKALPELSEAEFKAEYPGWKKLVADGKKTPKDLIATITKRNTLTQEQHAAISELDGVSA